MIWKKERKPRAERIKDRIAAALAGMPADPKEGKGPFYTNRAERRAALRGKR